jgi:hypothetical protein
MVYTIYVAETQKQNIDRSGLQNQAIDDLGFMPPWTCFLINAFDA